MENIDNGTDTTIKYRTPYYIQVIDPDIPNPFRELYLNTFMEINDSDKSDFTFYCEDQSITYYDINQINYIKASGNFFIIQNNVYKNVPNVSLSSAASIYLGPRPPYELSLSIPEQNIKSNKHLKNKNIDQLTLFILCLVFFIVIFSFCTLICK